MKQVRLHLWHLVPVLLFLPFVTSLIDQVCVSVGYENTRDINDHSMYQLKGGVYVPFSSSSASNPFCDKLYLIQSWLSKVRKSSASIGGAKFGSATWGSSTISIDTATIGYHSETSDQLKGCCQIYNSADSTAWISVYGVKYNNKYLNGWLGIEIDIPKEVVWLFTQVSDERGNAIGEFVINPVEETCMDTTTPVTTERTANPKEHQFLPCSATGLQEAKPSQAVVYTRTDLIGPYPPVPNPNIATFMKSPPVPDKGLRMKLTWRLNEYFCNRHAKFRVVVYLLLAINTFIPQTTVLKRGDWLIPKWFGAADIIPKGSTSRVTCTDEIKETSIPSDFWIKTVDPSASTNDHVSKSNAEYEGPPSIYKEPTLYKSCRTYLSRLQEHRDDVQQQPSFGGRCEKIDEKKFKPAFYTTTAHSKSSVDVPHQCLKNSAAEYPGKMDNYKEYMEKTMKSRADLCSKDKCPELKNVHLKEIKQALRPNWTNPATNATGRYIMKSRAYHGMMFTWAFLCFIPVSNFMARYFKETFLADDIVGVRVWYFVHVGLTFMVVNVSVSGLISNGKVTRVWGRSFSQAAINHRGMGWACIALYVVTIILGPLRPLRPRGRIIFMALHAFLGYFLYILGLFTIMNSALIPGSPSATTCYKKIKGFDPFVSPTFGDIYYHDISTAVTWWLGLDLFFHLLMNFMQWRADRSWEVQRRHYFPLVPIVHYDDRKSFKCFRYRTLVLIIYLFILSIIVIVTSQRLYETSWKRCDCGPMTCTHESLDPKSAYPEVQCGRLPIIRAKREEQKAQGSGSQQLKSDDFYAMEMILFWFIILFWFED